MVQDWRAPADDIMYTLFDLLCHVTPEEGAAAPKPGPAPQQASSEELTQSWCGALEAKLVGAAPPPHEGVRARRKRKLAQAEGERADAPLAAAAAASSRAQWASPIAHRQAFRCVSTLLPLRHICA